MKLLPKILKEAERLERGSVLLIASVHKIPSDIVDNLKVTLKTAHAEEKIIPELLGGAVMEWDDMRLDASVRGALQQLKTRI